MLLELLLDEVFLVQSNDGRSFSTQLRRYLNGSFFVSILDAWLSIYRSGVTLICQLCDERLDSAYLLEYQVNEEVTVMVEHDGCIFVELREGGLDLVGLELAEPEQGDEVLLAEVYL